MGAFAFALTCLSLGDMGTQSADLELVGKFPILGKPRSATGEPRPVHGVVDAQAPAYRQGPVLETDAVGLALQCPPCRQALL